MRLRLSAALLLALLVAACGDDTSTSGGGSDGEGGAGRGGAKGEGGTDGDGGGSSDGGGGSESASITPPEMCELVVAPGCELCTQPDHDCHDFYEKWLSDCPSADSADCATAVNPTLAGCQIDPKFGACMQACPSCDPS